MWDLERDIFENIWHEATECFVTVETVRRLVTIIYKKPTYWLSRNLLSSLVLDTKVYLQNPLPYSF